MPMFVFQGRNHEGEFVTGKRMGQSMDSIAEQLLKEGIVPVKINPEEVQENTWETFKNKLFEKKLTSDQLSVFARQMYTLYSSGVSLTLALRQLAQTSYSKKLSDALYKIVENLEGGKDLANSMQQYPDVFTPLMISMVRIGQDSGRLDEAFLSLHQYLELEGSAVRQIKTVLRYPMIVLITLFLASIVITVFVIPTFSQVFAQANIQLPLITQYLVNTSQFITRYWPYLLVVLGAIVWVSYRYLKTPKGQYEWSKFQLHLPIFGKILRRILLLRFAQSFSVVVKSGVPLVDGLGLVAESIQNQYIREQIHTMQTDIQHGKTLTQAAVSVTLFTPLELQMLSVSEETGELSGILEHLATFYQREVDYSLKRLGDVMEPILIFGVGILVLGLALVVYLPIWNMVKLVH